MNDKPEMAILVASIFGQWAYIEHELSLLLVRVLGATATPALAMYSVLTAQHLQLKSLEAAAKAALSDDDYNILQAVLLTTDAAQAERNKLAHWVWGGCTEIPNAMVLIEPKMMKDRDITRSKYFKSKQYSDLTEDKLQELYAFDHNHILLYTKNDLERAYRDLTAAQETVFLFQIYLDPIFSTGVLGLAARPDGPRVREQVFRQLCEIRLFREALDRIRADRKNSQQSTPALPPQEPNDT